MQYHKYVPPLLFHINFVLLPSITPVYAYARSFSTSHLAVLIQYVIHIPFPFFLFMHHSFLIPFLRNIPSSHPQVSFLYP